MAVSVASFFIYFTIAFKFDKILSMTVFISDFCSCLLSPAAIYPTPNSLSHFTFFFDELVGLLCI